MSVARRGGKGQPLVALVTVLALWIGARTWDPVEQAIDVPLPLPPTVAPDPVEPVPVVPPPPVAMAEAAAPMVREAETDPFFEALTAPSPARVVVADTPRALPLPPRAEPAAAASPSPPAPPQGAARPAQPPPSTPFAAPVPRDSASRWSVDSWVLVRDKANFRALSLGAPSYGASQAGAVVRYRLRPDSPLNPRAHLRVAGALTGREENEAAAGIGIQPVAALPVELIAEARVARFSGEVDVRPAVMAVGGIAPTELALGVTAEAYAQAGYVGGARATAFADGQVRLAKEIDLGLPERVSLTAGAGAWGGAQKAAERVDIGPSLAVAFPLGRKVYARATLDWREQVVGDAEPGSGPVFTFSAGF